MLCQHDIYDGTIQTFLKGLDIHSDNGVDVIASADTIGVSVLLLLPQITDRISLFQRLLNCHDLIAPLHRFPLYMAVIHRHQYYIMVA